MVICLEQGADLHMAQLMPMPLTVSCFSKTQIGFTFLVPAHLGSFGKRAVKRVCVYMCIMFFFVWAASYDGLMPPLVAGHRNSWYVLSMLCTWQLNSLSLLSAGYQPRPQVVDRGTTARYGGQLRYI